MYSNTTLADIAQTLQNTYGAKFSVPFVGYTLTDGSPDGYYIAMRNGDYSGSVRFLHFLPGANTYVSVSKAPTFVTLSGSYTTDNSGKIDYPLAGVNNKRIFVLSNISESLSSNYSITVSTTSETTVVLRVRNKSTNEAIINTSIPLGTTTLIIQP